MVTYYSTIGLRKLTVSSVPTPILVCTAFSGVRLSCSLPTGYTHYIQCVCVCVGGGGGGGDRGGWEVRGDEVY